VAIFAATEDADVGGLRPGGVFYETRGRYSPLKKLSNCGCPARHSVLEAKIINKLKLFR